MKTIDLNFSAAPGNAKPETYAVKLSPEEERAWTRCVMTGQDPVSVPVLENLLESCRKSVEEKENSDRAGGCPASCGVAFPDICGMAPPANREIEDFLRDCFRSGDIRAADCTVDNWEKTYDGSLRAAAIWLAMACSCEEYVQQHWEDEIPA